MVSIKTTQVDYFIPVMESVDAILEQIEASGTGFIALTLPDEITIYVNVSNIIQFLEVGEMQEASQEE